MIPTAGEAQSSSAVAIHGERARIGPLVGYLLNTKLEGNAFEVVLNGDSGFTRLRFERDDDGVFTARAVLHARDIVVGPTVPTQFLDWVNSIFDRVSDRVPVRGVDLWETLRNAVRVSHDSDDAAESALLDAVAMLYWIHLGRQV